MANFKTWYGSWEQRVWSKLRGCGISQEVFANELGVSRQYLNAILNGKQHNASMENRCIKALANILNKDVEKMKKEISKGKLL